MAGPVLAIMAAGMGSRYGGLKQIEPIGANGELLIDYSVYDAMRAGFSKIVFIIKREMDRDFREIAGDRIGRRIDVAYAYQELDDLPPGYAVPDGRVKPWGTVQALLAARRAMDGPFAAINADDYYGPSAFNTIHGWLTGPGVDDGKLHYAMVGYQIENTLSDEGGVTRGVCKEDVNGFLSSVKECRGIERAPGGARFPGEVNNGWTELPAGTLVSMNFWGLNQGFMHTAQRAFPEFLDENLKKDPMKCEFLLPTEINRQMREGLANVEVLRSSDIWYGMTYKEDRRIVTEAMAKKHADGLYPTPLWK